jgi:hypothetical protein
VSGASAEADRAPGAATAMDVANDMESNVARPDGHVRWTAVEILAISVLIPALIARFFARPHAVFWIDEAATGSIITEPSFALFWRDAYWHVSSPLYFVLLRGWSALFGFSNEALRFPSAIFSIAAPLCIALARLKVLSREDRLVWAAMFALWVPGIGFGQAARPYALELLFATLQTLAFISLVQRTNLRTTAFWVAFAALTISTHYVAAVLALTQGLIFVAVKRLEAAKQWPALLLLLPAIALVAWQGPEMARFMTPETSWYKIYGDDEILRAILYVLGGGWWILGLPALFLLALVIGLFRLKTPPPEYGPVFWCALASVAAAAILIGLAAARPMLTNRYLAPVVPGTSLFIVIGLRVLARGSGRAILSAAIAISAAILVFWFAVAEAGHSDSVSEDLNYQLASDDVMHSGARSVVFMWDNPNARAMHPEQIAAYGRFFFLRSRYPIEVIPAQPTRGKDPNEILLAAARAKRSAILWVYDTWVKETNARKFQPRISRIDPTWACVERRKPVANIGIVICLPKEPK